MTLRIGDTAPDFLALTTIGPVMFHKWIEGAWAILFSHPGDFTPVCTTELGALARLLPEFRRRNVKVIGLSIDAACTHSQWVRDIEATQGASVDFPLIADTEKVVAHMYGMIHTTGEDTHTVRTVFVIDPAKKVRLFYAYPHSTGRNFQELLRVVDSLQLTDRHAVLTPADWKPGDDVVIAPQISDADAVTQFPGGWNAPRPYLRYVRQPRAH